MSELTGIAEQLDILIKLSVVKIVEDKEFREQVKILKQVGFSPKKIAELTGKTANNVSVTLNSLNRKTKT